MGPWKQVQVELLLLADRQRGRTFLLGQILLMSKWADNPAVHKSKGNRTVVPTISAKFEVVAEKPGVTCGHFCAVGVDVLPLQQGHPLHDVQGGVSRVLGNHHVTAVYV